MERISNLLSKYNSMPIVAKATFWFLFCNITQKAISMMTIPVITRLLSPTEYGLYSVFVSYGTIFSILCTLHAGGNGYYVGMKKYGEDKQKYTSSVLGLIILLTTFLLGLFLVARNIFVQYTGLNVLVIFFMFAWIYGQSAIDLWFVENRYEYKYRPIVICTVLIAISTPIIKLISIFLFGKIGINKSLGAIVGYVVPVVIAGVASWIAILTKGKKLYDKKYWKFVLVFNIPLIPYYLSQSLLNQADRIMIERIDSVSSAGLYSVAYSLAMAISVINNAIHSTFSPWQFQTMKKEEYQRIAKTINIIMGAVVGVHLLLILVAPELMRVFAAKEYYDAIYVVPPVTIGVMLIWFTQIFINVEFYYEKNKLIAISSVLSATLNVILNAIAIPRFGYLAAAYTTLICYSTNMMFHGAVAVKLTKKMQIERTFELEKILVLIMWSIILMFVIMFMYNYILIRYGMLLCISFILTLKREKLKGLLRNVSDVLKEKQ